MVKRGMYVTKLDRHWLESPFLFQGFYVESDDQIDKLKTTCKYVYVDGEHQEQIYDPKESAFQGAQFDKHDRKPSSGAEQPTAGEDRQHETAELPDKFLDEIAGHKSFFRRIAWALTKKRKAPFEKEFRRANEVFETAQTTIASGLELVDLIIALNV